MTTEYCCRIERGRIELFLRGFRDEAMYELAGRVQRHFDRIVVGENTTCGSLAELADLRALRRGCEEVIRTNPKLVAIIGCQPKAAVYN